MKLKTGKEILIKYNQMPIWKQSGLTLEEMIDQEIERAISISKNAKVKVDFTELLKDKIKEIRRIKDQTPKGNIMYKEKMMMGTYGILICKDLLSKLKNRISV